MTRGQQIFWGLVVLVGLSVGGYFLSRSLYRTHLVAPFTPHLEAYAALGDKPQTLPRDVFAPPKAGKFVVIDKVNKSIDHDIYWSLPEDRRATTPEEVGTVVVINWTLKQIGEYTNGTPANVQIGHLVCCSPDGTQVSESLPFAGTQPPQQKKSSASGTGDRPLQSIVQHLLNLPN